MQSDVELNAARTDNRSRLTLTSRLTVLFASVWLGACSDAPVRENPPVVASASLGDEIAVRAIAQVGKPYRYGGADLQGFDCSGLVFFIHRELGFTVPRTAAEQFAASRPVAKRNLLPGDLVFFRTTSKGAVSHVGIYAGEGRFVHAPQTGRLIELRSIDDEYYGPRLVGAGRLTT